VAAALVAFEAINVEGERLIDEAALNAIIVLMVVTAIVGPIMTERFGKRLAARTDAPDDGAASETGDERASAGARIDAAENNASQ
jgi:hypothetical protein